MKRIVIIGLAVLLLAALGIGYFVLKSVHYRVVISQAQIDAALRQHFPITKPFLVFFELTYSNPVVTLLPEAQRVRVGLDAGVNVKIKGQTKKLSGGATVTGRVDYRRETHEFFLSDVKFERLTVAGIPSDNLQAVQTIAAQAAEEYLRRYPIYHLDANSVRMGVAKMLLRDVRVHDREVEVILGL